MNAIPAVARPDPEPIGVRAARSIRHPLSRALLVLTFSTGLVDAVSYLGLGRVFTANMTGNIVLLGLAVAQSLGPQTLRSLVALAAFAVGVAIAANVGPARGKEEVWPARTT